MGELSLGLDVGLAKLKLCVGAGSEDPRWTCVTLPYDARVPYARAGDFARGIPDAVRAFLGERTVSRVVAVTSAGYGYPTFHASVVHLAEVLEDLFPHAETGLLSFDGNVVSTARVRAGDDDVHGPLAFTNPAGAAFVARRFALLGAPARGLVLDTGGSTTGTVIVDGDTTDPAAMRERAQYTYHRVKHGKLAWYGLQTTPLEALLHEVVVDGVTLPVVPRGVPFENVAALLDLLPVARAKKLSFFGLGPTKAQAMRAIADAVGLDLSFVSERAVLDLARTFHESAITKLSEALACAFATAHTTEGSASRAVCFGLGASSLAKPALERLGLTDVHLARDHMAEDLAEVASVYGAYLAACTNAPATTNVGGARG